MLFLFQTDMPPASVAYLLFAVTGIIETSLEAIHNWSEVESTMVSYERCTYFEQIMPEENYKAFKYDSTQLDKILSAGTLWMDQQAKKQETIVKEGALVFENVSAKYNSWSNDVINSLSFEIRPKEKIGVIGRTGAGKSSLIKMLWKCLAPYQGNILIDDRNISDVDLKTLRNQVMVVSQDTVLLEGSLRENIDPLYLVKDDNLLIDILKRLQFKHQSFDEKKLEMQIQSDGENLSQGEKQLICFSRTLVNKRKLIILDEATANIDIMTEEVIQDAVKNDFSESTMLIIAHRIQTVQHCDRIMVFDAGRLVEFGAPEELRNKEGSYLKEIWDKTLNSE